jgi:hypothetical protein
MWVQVSFNIGNWVSKCVDKLQVATNTFCHQSVKLLWKIIWVWRVIHVFCFHVINYFGFTLFTTAGTRKLP